MAEVRYFTCKNSADMPAYDDLMTQIKVFRSFEDFAGEVRGDTGIPGLRLDFNLGLRLLVPKGAWHVTIRDHDTETLFFDEDVSDTRLISMEKYYVHWDISIQRDGEMVFSHIFDPGNQKVVFYCCHKALGDTLAFLPYGKAFQEKHHCSLYFKVPDYLQEYAAHVYPEIPQIGTLPEDIYAVFYIAAWHTPLGMPVDPRAFPMTRLAGTMVGMQDVVPMPVFRPAGPRKIEGKYVCISVQASTLAKGWHYPGGWERVVSYLKRLGYRVICIDLHAYQRELHYETSMPEEAEDETGDHSIMERADMLYYADFFIGLSSGLSWLSYAVGCPVLLISGMSEVWYEFYTPYRIVNRHVCSGCFNDVRTCFQSKFCPYHNGTDRELECSKCISPRQVLQAIDDLMQNRVC